jgi:hypothetical protein
MRGANVGIAQEVLSRSTSLRRPSLRRQIGRAGNTSHCQIPSGHYGHEAAQNPQSRSSTHGRFPWGFEPVFFSLESTEIDPVPSKKSSAAINLHSGS